MRVYRHAGQVLLTLSRLNGMWSFTGKQLTYKIDLFLQYQPRTEWEVALNLVSAYSLLARHAGEHIEYGVQPDKEWLRLFNEAGQAAIFTIPESLRPFDKRKFDKHFAKIFVKGYGEGESPP